MMMPVDPWSGAYLATAFAMWAVMMVAMMIPSATPMILLHGHIDRSGSSNLRLLHSLLFVAAYLAVWTGIAAAIAIAQALLIGVGLLSAQSLTLGDRAIAVALLLLAATYELTPVKARCLEQCQSPSLFLPRYWKPGAAGAFGLGVRHGLYCVACCWALMLLLFVGGVMNLAWVALLGGLAAVEKMAPPRWSLHRWIAGLLMIGALLLAMW